MPIFWSPVKPRGSEYCWLMAHMDRAGLHSALSLRWPQARTTCLIYMDVRTEIQGTNREMMRWCTEASGDEKTHNGYQHRGEGTSRSTSH